MRLGRTLGFVLAGLAFAGWDFEMSAGICVFRPMWR